MLIKKSDEDEPIIGDFQSKTENELTNSDSNENVIDQILKQRISSGEHSLNMRELSELQMKLEKEKEA